MKVSFRRFLTELSVGAGDTLLKYFRKPHCIQRKPNQGIVTEADKAAEAFVLKKISRAFPDSTIITEESGEYPGRGALCWIIDPLDG
ncbi:MAG: hypothetical protein KDD51_16510, partial [Bdellovibrionales bacterium]|nr:hypothetical protein [Bdellovibrionales bacterium]